jgi:hypothetical protein
MEDLLQGNKTIKPKVGKNQNIIRQKNVLKIILKSIYTPSQKP